MIEDLSMPVEAGRQTNGERDFDLPIKTDTKRNYQRFMDGTGTELLSNKKQATKARDSGPVLEISNKNFPQWNSTSRLQSLSGVDNHQFGAEPVRNVKMVDRSIPSVIGQSLNMGRMDSQDRYNNASMRFSLSPFEDPSHFNLLAIENVKVNQVMDSGIGISASMRPSYVRGNNSLLSDCMVFGKRDDNMMSAGANKINSDKKIASTSNTICKRDFSFFSMGCTLNKREEDCLSVGYNHSRGDGMSLLGQSFDRRDGNFMSIGQISETGDGKVMSMSSYTEELQNFMSIGQNYDNTNENFIPVGSFYNKGTDNKIGILLTHDPDSNITPIGSKQDKGDSGFLSLGHNFEKSEQNTISSYGSWIGTRNSVQTSKDQSLLIGVQNSTPISQEPNLLIGTQNSAQASQKQISLIHSQNSDQASRVPSQPNLVEANLDSTVNILPVTNPRTVTAPLPMAAKKAPVNNFPSGAKSLLSTGMLDGIHVKYVSWSREKSLKGTIKGIGFLCGCRNCNYTKAVSSFEFERHANCKTKHPNNHIYFENGKTLYGVVQELQNTPEDKLFDAIQNVTGSQIHQKNYNSWKESYITATRELQRIYRKDDTVFMPSSG